MARVVACRICGQEREHAAHGRCTACDRFWRKNGWDKPSHFQKAWDAWNIDVLRFMRFVRHEGNCWKWSGHKRLGYGMFQVGGRGVAAHRWIYEQLVGPIPDGLQIDHLCRTSACVFPGHLEPVTPAENSRRGIRAQQTHCKRGHPLSGDNLYVGRDKRGYDRRHCRACRDESVRRFKEREKAQKDEWRRKRGYAA